MSFVQWSSWCLAIILACFQYAVLCLVTHSFVPFAVHVVWIQPKALAGLRLLRRTGGSVAVNVVGVFLLVMGEGREEVLGVDFSRVLFWFAPRVVGFVGFVVGVAACAAALPCVTFLSSE